MRKLLSILKMILLITMIVGIYGFVTFSHNNSLCKKIEITFEDNHKYYSQENVIEFIKNENIDVLETKLKNLDINKIERILQSKHYIENANVYLTIDEILRINIKHRNPIVRIMNSNYENFMIDDKGKILYLSENFTPKVLYANGNINKKNLNYSAKNIVTNKEYKSLMKNNIVADIYSVSNYIYNDSVWKSMIDQIYINNDNEIELIPKMGAQIIILGNAENIDNKFKKLEAFYKQGMINIDWDKYSVINLKYKNQVVCK